MALRRQVIDFRGLGFLHQTDQIGGVRHVAVVQVKTDVPFVRVLVQMVDTVGIERRRTPFDPVNGISLAEQQFSQKGSVLPGHAGNQCNFIGHAADSSHYPSEYRTDYTRWTGGYMMTPFENACQQPPFLMPQTTGVFTWSSQACS